MSDVLTISIQIAVLVSIVIGIALQIITYINVRRVEVATNSMKDALVAATEKAAGLAGEERGRQEERTRNV